MDIEFHQYLWRKSGLRLTRKILMNIYYQILLCIMEDLKHAESLEETARLHYEVIKSLRLADIKALEENRAYSYFVRRKTGFADVQGRTNTGSLLPEEKPAAL